MTLQVAGQPIKAATINRQYTLADASDTTVNGASLVSLCSAYTVPASDAAQFTGYRLTAWGHGTWGTAEKLTFAMALAGVNIGVEPAIAGAAFSNAALFDWEATLTLKCNLTGASGTWSASLRGVVSQSANAIVPGTAADNSVPFVGVTLTDVVQDTTVANTIVIQAEWAALTGAPTIVCTDTMFERLAV